MESSAVGFTQVVTNCGTMTFWGAATTYGVARPDVAAALGHSRYTNSGFTFTKAGLPSGTYYVAVVVHNTVTGSCWAACQLRPVQ